MQLSHLLLRPQRVWTKQSPAKVPEHTQGAHSRTQAFDHDSRAGMDIGPVARLQSENGIRVSHCRDLAVMSVERSAYAEAVSCRSGVGGFGVR
jgi:hypothetical protein